MMVIIIATTILITMIIISLIIIISSAHLLSTEGYKVKQSGQVFSSLHFEHCRAGTRFSLSWFTISAADNDDHAADGEGDEDDDQIKIILFNLILPKCWWRRVFRRSLARDCIAAQIFKSAFTIDVILERFIFGDKVVIWWDIMRQDRHLSDLLSFVLTRS